ncbi:hypothetical protein Cgig2_013707 [Carnegiea gigantea]|uniref:Uncharacterized protein n=1 Tax=Carnegiea gigantea TaxID=171969 RepID=A0A9Q1QD25_9CARY|nr:hypothetical protein Cgig2_013707 [Carnegiea gigantea]
MSVDDIVVEIHHAWEKICGWCQDNWEFAKDIGFTNVEEFYYLIPRMSLREGLRTYHNNFESLDMAVATTVHKRLVGGCSKEISMMVKNVIKRGLDGSTSTFGSQNSRGIRVKHTPTKSLFSRQKQKAHKKCSIEEPVQQAQTPTPIPTSTPTSATTPISSPTSITQKPHSHDIIPIFNVNHEHDWEDPRPELHIPWHKLIESESFNEESSDSEYVPKTEVDLEAFEDIAGSISKARGKRKINNDDDKHDLDTNIQAEWETNVEDLETSDKEWAATRAKVGECKKQNGLGRIDNAEQVGKQDMTVDKSATSSIEQIQLGLSFHSDYESSEAEMDTDRETDDDVSKLLRKKEKPINVDEHTDFKKLKWQVGMTFKTVQGFNDAILRFKENPTWPAKELVNALKKNHEIVINKWTANKDIPSSSRPQSMTDQGRPLIFNKASVATSSS